MCHQIFSHLIVYTYIWSYYYFFSLVLFNTIFSTRPELIIMIDKFLCKFYARSSKSNEREEGGWSGCIVKNFYRNFNLGIFTWQAITLSLQPLAVFIYLLYINVDFFNTKINSNSHYFFRCDFFRQAIIVQICRIYKN